MTGRLPGLRSSVWVLAMAVVVRLAVGLDAADAPFWSSPLVDEVAYLQMSEREARDIAPEYGAYYMTPGYAWFLVGLNRLGAQLPQVKWVQLGVGALSCWLLFLLGRAFFEDPRVGWVAALWWMFFPVALLHELLALKATVAVFSSLLALWAWSRARKDSRWWLVVGLAAGSASLLRAEQLPIFVVLLVVAAVARAFQRPRWAAVEGRARGPLAALAVVAVLVAVPTARNLARGGGPVLIAYGGGVNFYIGNHPGADGSYLPLRPDRSDAAVEEHDAVQIARQQTGRPLRAAGVSRFWWGRGLHWWVEDPVAALGLTAKKALLWWGWWEGDDVLSPAMGGRWVVLLRPRFLRSGVVLALALVGLFLSRRRRSLWPLWGWLLLNWLALIPFFVFERFRLSMVAVGALFAGVAVVWSYDRLRERRWSRAATPWIAAAALGGMLALPKVARNDTVLRVNVGTLLLQQDRPAEALREFEAVRRQAPGAFRVDINIASALHALGRDREAMAALQRVRPRLQAEARRTGRPPVEELVYVHVLTGDILKARGDLDSARQEYLEAWKLRPGLPALKKKLSEIGKRTPTP